MGDIPTTSLSRLAIGEMRVNPRLIFLRFGRLKELCRCAPAHMGGG